MLNFMLIGVAIPFGMLMLISSQRGISMFKFEVGRIERVVINAHWITRNPCLFIRLANGRPSGFDTLKGLGHRVKERLIHFEPLSKLTKLYKWRVQAWPLFQPNRSLCH